MALLYIETVQTEMTDSENPAQSIMVNDYQGPTALNQITVEGFKVLKDGHGLQRVKK